MPCKGRQVLSHVHHARPGDQAVSIAAGRQRRLARDRAGRVPRAARSLRQRQEHAAARHRGPGRDRPRARVAARPGRHRRHRPRPRRRLRVPALRPVPPHERRGQRRVRAARAAHEARRPPGAPAGAAEARRPRGHGRAPSGAALRRPAAARRRRARARAPAGGAAARRALRRARRQDPRGTPAHDPPDPAGARHHHDPRHPRPGRGLRDGRPHRRHAPGPPARGRRAGRPVREPAHPLRRHLPRRGEPAARLPARQPHGLRASRRGSRHAARNRRRDPAGGGRTHHRRGAGRTHAGRRRHRAGTAVRGRHRAAARTHGDRRPGFRDARIARARTTAAGCSTPGAASRTSAPGRSPWASA